MAEQSLNKSQERPRAEAVNEKLSTFKKFAATSFTRAKQFTIEKIGKSESVTTYDEEFEDLYTKVNQIKAHTERILAQVDNMVQPNPGIRIETMVYSRLDRQVPHHSSPHELLGVELTRSGNEFGPETQYGGYLVRCGEVERKIGVSEKKYQEKVNSEVVVPLRAFLEVDIKNVFREYRTLYGKRLDLDSCRNFVKKAQQDIKLQQAETALRDAQADYDMQMDLVRNAMRKIVDTHVNNQGRMKSLMTSLKAYYMECIAHLDDINTGSINLHSSITSQSSASSTTSKEKGDSVKGKALFDFDAREDKEISVFAGQIVLVFPDESDEEYYMVQVDSKFGFVPQTYIELL